MNHKLSVSLGSVMGAIVATSIVMGYTASSAQSMRMAGASYIGLWEGIDEVDGGNSLRSILPDELGFKVIGQDTWHGPCGYGDPAVGISRVNLAADGSLKGRVELDCQAGETADTGDRAFKVRYTYDPATQTLTETFLDPESEAPISRPPIVFFRQSQPIRPQP